MGGGKQLEANYGGSIVKLIVTQIAKIKNLNYVWYRSLRVKMVMEPQEQMS